MRWVVAGGLVLCVALFAAEAKLGFVAKEGQKQVWTTKATIKYETDVAGSKQKVTETLEGEAELTCGKGEGEILQYTLKPVKFRYTKDDGKKKIEVSSDKKPPEDDWVLPLLKGKMEAQIEGVEASANQLKVGGAFDGKGLAITVAALWLPDKSVKEGECWTGESELALPGLAIPLKLTWEFKLKKLEGKTAVVEAAPKKAEVTLEMKGYSLKLEGKLSAKIEAGTGRVKEVKTSLKWDFSVKGEGAAKMAGKGTWEEEVKAK